MSKAGKFIFVLALLGFLALPAHGKMPENRTGEGKVMNRDVVTWVREAPFDNPIAMQTTPNFSYEEWMARGRALPGAIETLIAMLDHEDLRHPSGDGMRTAYALGWIGDKRKEGVAALLRVLDSSDVALRVEAASALGRQGDASVLPVLETLMKNEKEDVNVRANACIAMGRIGSPSSEPALSSMLDNENSFLATCAREAFRLLAGKR